MNTLKYLRFKIFRALLNPFSAYMRNNRMRLFIKTMTPVKGMKILDLGGQPFIWDFVDIPLNITCLNLPGIVIKNHNSHHEITYVEGDACDMPNFQYGDFDMIFSNSVIEHVGNIEKQIQFAREVTRLSNHFWIQTPSKFFPIEAHCGMPFWWFYPPFLRAYFLERWSKKLPAWTEMVSTTTFVDKKNLEIFFPNCEILTEWFIFPKSLIVYSTSTKTTS